MGLYIHHNLSLWLNTRQTRMGRVCHSVSYLECTILHEFGHTLQMQHVAGSGYTDAAYGTSLEQREDLMGVGDHAGAARHGRGSRSCTTM